MPELRPLILPQLVAARNSAITCNDTTALAKPVASIHSSDSSQSAPSECSTPLTPTFFMRGHTRHPSSSSSLSSTPPTSYEHVESNGSTSKLPGLAEDPSEREDGLLAYNELFVSNHDTTVSPCLCDVGVCAHQTAFSPRSTVVVSPNAELDLSDGIFSDDADLASQHLAKRRRSGESPLHSIATRLGDRFPSLSKRLRDRKVASVFTAQTTRSATPSRAPSTRSSSVAGSVIPGLDQMEAQFPTSPTKGAHEHVDDTVPSSPINIVSPQNLSEPVDQQALASTPLLPPMMVACRVTEEAPLQSPLQSPTVADPTLSIVNTPAGTPQLPGMVTPPLSTKPSVASFRLSRPGHLVPSLDIPPITIAESSDEWSMKLGHANFVIYPEPYLPEVCDASACRKLFADWEQARCNFTKHQVRTGEHYGVTSKTYKLTEQKWAEIDAQWRKNNDAAVAKAAESSQDSVPITPTEPAPLTKLPSLNDPKCEGKFPKLGDEDIVGPMVQAAAPILHSPSKRTKFMKFLGEIKIPGTFLGRSSGGLRSPT